MTHTDFFKKIQEHYDKELPFVAYKKPNESSVNVLLQKDDQLHFVEDFTEAGFVFSLFDSEKKTILIPLNRHTELISVSLISFERNTNDKKIESQSHQKDKKNHVELVQKGIDTIKNNQFQKVVLSRREELILKNPNPVEIFRRLLTNYPNAFTYIWYHPKIGLWLGATPENLLKVEENQLKTTSLAGTQSFRDTEITWEEKEKEEQQIVTHYIVKVLKKHFSEVNISKPYTIKAGNLVHLKTDITATIQNEKINLQKIVKALHPTPAVCGFPKDTAKKFILENENYDREFYTGFLGELNMREFQVQSLKFKVENSKDKLQTKNLKLETRNLKPETHLFVNLRCMQLKKDNTYIYIGGGITKDSIPKKEWEETINKSQTIKKAISLSN